MTIVSNTNLLICDLFQFNWNMIGEVLGLFLVKCTNFKQICLLIKNRLQIPSENNVNQIQE